MLRQLSALLLLLLAGGACATVPATGGAAGGPPGLAEISAEELRRDLFALAGDGMRGRGAGTLDELRASVWLAERAREAGLQPAGEDGTYFQFFPIRRVRLSDASHLSIGGVPLRLWEDAIVMSPVGARIEAPVTWLDATEPIPASLSGRVVVAALRPPSRLPAADVSLRAWRYAVGAVREQAAALRDRGAVAVVLVADSTAMQAFGRVAHWQEHGRYLLGTPRAAGGGGAEPVVVLVRPGVIPRSAGTARAAIELAVESWVTPSVNVVARVPGTDPAARDEHVLFSGHQDHDGVGHPVDGDSIWNGADDNATVSVAMLAIGRAFARHPGRRSALFVWHGAEERGLLGSRWFVDHPTVPRGSIAAVLNGDMIGRNHPDSAALLGAVPPHRNSTALVEMALEANRRVTGFQVDHSWDDPSHPEGWYFRSDHLPYARAQIPAIFFTTLLHPDYHTPRDEPERIDVAKLARMTRWMYATGWAVANAARRPEIDPGFRLER